MLPFTLSMHAAEVTEKAMLQVKCPKCYSTVLAQVTLAMDRYAATFAPRQPQAMTTATAPKAMKKASAPKAMKKATAQKAMKKASAPKAMKKATAPKAMKTATAPKALS